MKVKRCPRCKETKRLDKFYPDKTRANGISVWCRSCRSEYKKKYDSEHLRARRESNLRIKFGLSIEAHDQMFEKQGGVCAVCGRPENIKYKGTVRSLAVDHNHITGKVRGLLCQKCNQALGLLEENPVVIKNLVEYIIQNG